MHITHWLLCLIVPPHCKVARSLDINSTKLNATNADPRNPTFKAHVLDGYTLARRLARGRTIWLHEVLNWDGPGGSSNLAAFTHIELDVIVSNLRHAGSLDIATLHGGFDWGYWRASLTDFRPRKNGRVHYCRPILSRHRRGRSLGSSDRKCGRSGPLGHYTILPPHRIRCPYTGLCLCNTTAYPTIFPCCR